MKCVTMGLDLGNESVKLVDYVGNLVLPNVICRSSTLRVYDDRIDPLDYINYSLMSDVGSGEFFVGNLASRQDSGRTLFMPATANKAEELQYYVGALGSIAYRALTSHLGPDDSELAVRLVISLPMRDWFKSRRVVEQRLKGLHLAHMGPMPQYGDRTVSLHIEDVLVSIEGMAALIHNVYHPNGAIKNATLRDGDIRIVDIGKETTDLPRMKRMVPQPEPESTWEDWGAGRYLDNIIRNARDQFGVIIPNPARLVTCLANEGGEWKVRGRSINLRPLAAEEFSAMAERAARTVEAHFTDDIDACILVGGAADAIRPFLGDFLDLKAYPVCFGKEGECYLENARGNYLLGLGRKWPPVEINYRVA